MSSYFTLTLDTSLNDRVFRFANKVYNQNKTMQTIFTSQNIEISGLEQNFMNEFNNTFITTAKEDGIRRYEKMLNIIPDVLTEDIEFRRKRVITKISMSVPFTRIFLEQMLNELFGEGKWELEINPSEYLITIIIETNINNLFGQFVKDVRQIIPANIKIETVAVVPFTLRYLERFTLGEMEQFTYGELSKQ